MVDEDAFRSRWAAIDTLPCPFAKALLGGHAGCTRHRRIHLADRVGINCDDPGACDRCGRFLDALQGMAREVLQSRHPGEALPHAQALKLQAGGLRGLRAALGLGTAAAEPVADVDELLARATRYLPPEALPSAALVAAVAAFQVRPRRRG
jgi:hypothetical protein